MSSPALSRPHAATSSHGIVLVLLAAMLWGTTGTANSFAPEGLSPYWVGALRLGFAAAFFAVLALVAERGRRTAATAMDWPRLLLCALCMVAYNLLFFAALHTTGVGLGTAAAIGSSPIWAGMLQALLQRQWPQPLWWAGTAIGVAGGLVMALANPSGHPASWQGLVMCLLAGLAYGCYAVLSQPLVRRCGVSRVNVGVFALAALVALPLAWVVSGSAPHTSAQGWAVVAYLGLVATGVAYLLFSLGLRSVSAATSVALSKVEPITAFVLSIVLVGERASTPAVLGLVLVLGGLWLVVHSELRSPRTA